MASAPYRAARWLLAALWIAAGTICAGAGEPPLAFTTHGGDAWTFEKPIELTVSEGACDEVALASPAATLVERPVSGRVRARLPLVAGSNVVRAECRKGGVRASEPITQHWLVRLRDAPRARVTVHAGVAGLTLDAGASEPAASRPAPINRYLWHFGPAGDAPARLPGDGSSRVTVPTPAKDGDYRVRLVIADEAGRTDGTTVALRVSGGKVHAVDDMRDRPAWVRDAVIYGVMLPAFDPPGLAGVMGRLDALRALGVDTLWLSPLTASAPADFGYAVTDHFALRSNAGSEADLRSLVAASHARNMRVILDFVPNHLSDRHPYYVDAARHGRASPYFDFFERTPAGEAAHYFDWTNLKNLNYANPEVRQMMIEAFAHWVRAFDIDGFRVDVAWGPRRRAPDFWPHWRRELKRINPDLLLLAEASARDPFYGANGFDAAYDWTDQLGEWAWAKAFAAPGHIAARLRSALAGGEKASTPVFRFLNNNDTGARFVTRHGAAKTRVAAAMLMTLPGIPGLYTGDETGAEFEPYDQRGAIAWTDRHGLQAWYTALLRLRRDAPALRSHGLRMLDLADAGQVLGYVRPGGTPREGVLVLLNYGAEPAEVTLPEDALAGLGAAGGTLQDLLDEDAVVRADGRPIRLAGHGVRILQPR